MNSTISIQIQFADVRTFQADVLVLKYAQGHHGVDRIIAYDLNQKGNISLSSLSPAPNKYALAKNTGTSNFSNILFIGVPHLDEFNYQEIANFSRESLRVLSKELPRTKSIAMTIHGAGYGLDEEESIISQIKGFIEAIQHSEIPEDLESIFIIENNKSRIPGLKSAINNFFKNTELANSSKENEWLITVDAHNTKISKTKSIKKEAIKSEDKPHIFVAMPFHKNMYDVYTFGIHSVIKRNKFLCARIDEEYFTGDVLTRIKGRIETAAAVIVDLTQSNANVFLELGYAWGKNKTTILVKQEDEILKFDVQNQRCLNYKNITHLEQILNKELKELIAKGEIKR